MKYLFATIFGTKNRWASSRISLEDISEKVNRDNIRLIIIDFDGTLCQNNSMLAQLRQVQSLNSYLKLLIELKKGKSSFKVKLTELVPELESGLRLNRELFNWIIDMQLKNFEVVIATASDQRFIESHIDSIGLTVKVLGSDANENLKGIRKRHAIQFEYPNQSFAYFGDSRHDIPIWQHSSLPVVVNSNTLKHRIFSRKVSNLVNLEAK